MSKSGTCTQDDIKDELQGDKNNESSMYWKEGRKEVGKIQNNLEENCNKKAHF